MNQSSRALGLLAACLVTLAACRTLCAQSPQPSVAAAIEVVSTNVYQNEEFKLTFIVQLNGVRAQKDMTVISLPDSSALWLGPFSELPTKQFVVSGQSCEQRRSFYTVRCPATGPLEIAPIIRIVVLTGRRSFFGEEAVSYDIRARPLILHVLPLPDHGRPASFSGAVGQFSFDVAVAPTNVTVGTLVHLTPRIRGTGFLETVSSPRIAQSPHFKIYDPKPVASAVGERTYEQIVIPQSTNALAIPAISFSHFDPQTGSYRTIARGPFSLSHSAAPHAVPAPEPYRPRVENTGPSSPQPTPVPRTERKRPGGPAAVRAWLTMAGAAGALSALLLLAGAAFLRQRRAAYGATLALLILALILSLHMAVRSGWLAEPEAVVARHEAARFAPAHSAVASFELPEGTTVRIAEIRGQWAKISLGGKRGWIPADALKQP